MLWAISIPVAFSMPSSPGDELTSRSKGPLLERMMSTPATERFSVLVALMASLRSSGVILIKEAVLDEWFDVVGLDGGCLRTRINSGLHCRYTKLFEPAPFGTTNDIHVFVRKNNGRKSSFILCTNDIRK